MIWRSSYHSRIAQSVDLVTTFVSLLLSFPLWNLLHNISPAFIAKPFELRIEHIILILIFSFIYVVLFNLQRAYSYQRFTSLLTEYSIIIKVTFIGGLIFLAVLFLLGYGNLPRILFVISTFNSLVLLTVQKTALFYLAASLRKQGKNRKTVLIVGTGERAKEFINTVRNNFGWGLDIIGLLTGDKERVGKKFFGIKVIEHYNNISQVLKDYNPEEIIITISSRQFDQIRGIIEKCELEGVQVRLNSDFLGRMTKKIKIDNVYGLNIVSFYQVKQNEIEITLKRLIDIMGAFTALIIFSPFMLIASLGILITSGRPILYSWNVIGLNKKPFRSWKFRTMIKDADTIKDQLMQKNEMDGPVFKIKEDPRILPFGKWLRKWSIDETPQLFSIIKGDMSLVGPRPAFPKELEKYESWQRRKLSVKPGLTCLWQANGRNKINKFDDWVKLDLEYIDNWSVLLDIKILLKTIPTVITGRGSS